MSKVAAPLEGSDEEKAKGLPSGGGFAAARWEELNSPQAPWWARSQGIGIRLRLRELLDIAEARNEGATLEQPLIALRKEAFDALLLQSSFLRRRHGETAKQLRMALEKDRSDPMPPSGLNYSIVQAALAQLDEQQLRTELIGELSAQADSAKTYRHLEGVGELVELLDAELAYDGFSPARRRDIAAETVAGVREGAELTEAIEGAIGSAERGWPKKIGLLIPVRMLRKASGRAVTKLLDLEDVNERLTGWLGQASIEGGFSLGESHAFAFEIEDAVDMQAAVKRANEWLEEERALYALQGGELEPADKWLAVDSARKSESVNRPSPLWLLPRGLSRIDKRFDVDPAARQAAKGQNAVVDDALVQLAQARRGSDGAALSDLWTVIEAVFAGAANEPRYLAGEVMSELLQYLYPLALLTWAAKRLVEAGLERENDGLSDAAWALDQFEKNPGKAFAASHGDVDPLLYVRSVSFGKWSARPDGPEPSERMGEELDAVSKRCGRIAARAYLVRNFQVHRAQPQRANALAATLPVFAEMARIALGYIAQDDGAAELPITTAKLSLMKIRQVAFDFEAARRFGGAPLREALGADLSTA